MNRPTSLLPIAVVLAGLAQAGCFLLVPPQPGAGGAGTTPSSVNEPAAATKQAPGGKVETPAAHDVPAPKMIPVSVEIHSECDKTVPVFYGDGKPGFSSGTKSSISSNSISSQGRKADGTLTIWIIDEHENGLSNVHVTPDTRRVTVERSCTSLRAE